MQANFMSQSYRFVEARQFCPFRSFIEKREHQFAFGDDGIVHHAVALRFCQSFAARCRELGMNENAVSWQNWLAKFHPVGTHKIADSTRGCRELEPPDASDMGHGV